MTKINLTEENILNKEFNIEFKGYSSLEVDQFLDIVLEDYQNFNEELTKYKNELDTLKMELASVKAKNIELEATTKFNESNSSINSSSVDLLQRVSRLEEELLRK